MLRFGFLSALVWAMSAPAAVAQSVVVDQGTFAILIDGEEMGSEEFSIRRAGLLNNAAFIASGVVSLRHADGVSELRPVLRARAPVGATDGYQLKVTGPSPLEVTMNVAGPRFVSRFQSTRGREEREFRARPETRILDSGIAHHYYFLRALREGDTAPIISPQLRLEGLLRVSAVVDEELQVGKNLVQARRVTFEREGYEQTVWFDRQGRVIRVEIPSEGYVAVRRDLVG